MKSKWLQGWLALVEVIVDDSTSDYLLLGGKLVYLYTKKQGKVPKCGDCKKKLQGVSILWF